jgi:hypothetical protein
MTDAERRRRHRKKVRKEELRLGRKAERERERLRAAEKGIREARTDLTDYVVHLTSTHVPLPPAARWAARTWPRAAAFSPVGAPTRRPPCGRLDYLCVRLTPAPGDPPCTAAISCKLSPPVSR